MATDLSYYRSYPQKESGAILYLSAGENSACSEFNYNHHPFLYKCDDFETSGIIMVKFYDDGEIEEIEVDSEYEHDEKMDELKVLILGAAQSHIDEHVEAVVDAIEENQRLMAENEERFPDQDEEEWEDKDWKNDDDY